ncbi:MAG: molecular chaperone DnaK [Chloroflexota bacterium]|nr:molecular chaperone DnaK [Chloroflexota bacterium]
MARTIGIDLGTTNSVMAVMEGGEPTVIPNAEGGRTTPSVVAVNPKTGERLVGQIARRQAITNPENTIYSIKRFMGRRFDDPEVQRATKTLPYKVSQASHGAVQVHLGDRTYTPQEISAMILRKLKQDAEAYLNDTVDSAIITVPAYFDDSQRQATKDAGQIAGLDVKRIINEPTAASMAYGLDRKQEEDVAVYDLGGGTYDISILALGEGVFDVQSIQGDTYLGGDDFDDRIINWLVDEFRKDQGIDLRTDPIAMQRLKEDAERVKKELSTTQQSEINLPYITVSSGGPKNLLVTLTRSKLEQLVGDLVDRTVPPMRQALKDAGKAESQIDEVLLVGGQTRMPLVQEKVKSVFGKEPNRSINPDEVVAVGAAIQAGVLGGEVKDVLLLDVTPLTLAIETLGGVATPLIARNTTIPTRKAQTFTTAADGQTQVEIHVTQGERPMASENKTLARFILDQLPPAPRNVPQIEVAFDIDANGILNVSAKDQASSREQKITITASSGLSQEEVDRMVHDAEVNAGEDQRRRELIEARNTADTLVYQTEKTLQEHGDKISEETKTEVNEKLEAARTALQGEDVEAIRSTMQALAESAQKIGSEMYSQGGEGQPTGAYGPETGAGPDGDMPPADDGTVEGEFREV